MRKIMPLSDYRHLFSLYVVLHLMSKHLLYYLTKIKGGGYVNKINY